MDGFTVDETLETMVREYPPQIRLLKKAEYGEPNVLQACLRADPNWAYQGSQSERSPVNHFTLAEAVFAQNQMAYVILACMAQAGHLEGVRPLSLDIMNKKKFNDMLITQFSADFKRAFLSSEEFRAEFTVKEQTLRRTRSGIYVFTKNEFTFEKDKAYGTSAAAVRLTDDELLPEKA